MNIQQSLLLVEDNADDIFFMRRALKGAEIVNPLAVVMDGQEAIDYLSGENQFSDRQKFPTPCLIFLDLKLPHRSGHEVLAWIREQQILKTVVVLVLTTSKERRDIDQAYQQGANGYLVKPSSPPELLQMMVAVKHFWLKYNNYPSSRIGEPGCSAD
jgi:CheY-like chemotaxis protein